MAMSPFRKVVSPRSNDCSKLLTGGSSLRFMPPGGMILFSKIDEDYPPTLKKQKHHTQKRAERKEKARVFFA